MNWTSPKGHPLANYCRLVTNDLDEAREHVSRMWEHHRSHLKRGRTYGLRWHQANLKNTSLNYACSPSRIHVECASLGDYYRISMPESGRLYHRIDGKDVVSTATCAVLHAPGQELNLDTEPFARLQLSFDGSFVRKFLSQRFEKMPSFEEWPRAVSLTTPPGAALRELCRWTSHELDRPGADIVTSRRAAASLERTLLMLFLNTVAHHTPVSEQRCDDVVEARVRRIEAWVDENFAEPIGIEDLAQVAGVSVRSVQTAFFRVRGYTPMQYVTKRRLQAARERLLRAGAGSKVTDVAVDCGFFNFSRFSAQYRQAFGEVPSQTLGRS